MTKLRIKGTLYKFWGIFSENIFCGTLVNHFGEQKKNAWEQRNVQNHHGELALQSPICWELRGWEYKTEVSAPKIGKCGPTYFASKMNYASSITGNCAYTLVSFPFVFFFAFVPNLVHCISNKNVRHDQHTTSQ